MLKIIRCGFSSIGKEDIKCEIKQHIENGGNALMIVPEQQTVMTEIEMASYLPKNAPLFFEVTNFTRLTNTTFRALGGINGEYCDKGKKTLIMWRALSELTSELAMTRGHREISMGLVEGALRAVGELEALSIKADMLLPLLENEEIKKDKRLLSKLSDISKIYSLYKKLLLEKYNDGAEDFEIMEQKLKENPKFLSGHNIYLDGFTSFTEPQYRLIGLLAQRAMLTVTLATSKHTEDFFEQSELKETKERLVSIARKSSSDIKLADRVQFDGTTAEVLSVLVDMLWRKNLDYDNIALQTSDEIRVFEAKTPFDECRFIASDIKRRVMEGTAFRDFAIIARDETAYAGILDGALKSAKIPHFSQRRKDSEAYELVKLIYSAYSAIRSGFAGEDVITYAKCGLSGITRRECDIFEGYVDTWGLTGSRFTDDILWNMNPEGYSSKKKIEAAAILLGINNTRKKLLSPLINLKTKSRDARTVKEQALVLLDFLEEVGAENGLKARYDRLMHLGEIELAEENLGLWKLVCSSLDTLVEVMGDTECSSEGFVDRLKILFSSIDNGKIPAHYDEVTLGNADTIRLSGKKHVYLIGVNDGVFPAIPKDDSYFTEKDKEILYNIGLNIKPQLSTKGARELYIFSRAISYAKESVTLTYSATDARFKSTEPSGVIKKIEQLTSGRVKPIKISNLGVSDSLYVAEFALEAPDSENALTVNEALVESGYKERLFKRGCDITNTDMRLGDFYTAKASENDLSLSQSKIDSYASCPLSYFCKYGLSLSPEKKAEFDSSGVGTLIHAILENFFSSLRENNMNAGMITPKERVELTRRAAEKYIGELGEDIKEGSNRTKIKIERLCRAALPVVEGLCEEFSVSKFLPKFFELSISSNNPDAPDPIKIKSGSNNIVIGGIIDRVDTYLHEGNIYVRVVDYKTGKKEFTPDDLKEGKNLQMFLYLRSIVESENESFKESLGAKAGGRIIPAGALYLKTFVGDKNIVKPDDSLAVSTIKGEQKRMGMLLDDEEIIRAMGIKYTPLYREHAKNPDAIPESKRNLLFSEEGFEALMETVEESVIRIADGMRSGNIKAEPRIEKSSSACDYCDYKPICRNVKMSKKY